MITNGRDQRPKPSKLAAPSVRTETQGGGSGLEAMSGGFVLSLASVADSFTAWGRAPRIRDRQLREFWPTEPILASAIYNIVIRNAAFSWTLEGPPLIVAATQQMLQQAEFGDGWQAFATRFLTDLFTQDNGGFFEIIRAADSPDAPVVGIAHLDALKCTRTGDRDFPVTFADLKGVHHKLAYYQVEAISEFPSPIESMRGMQLCAVSRVLRAAQILRDIGIYRREKIGGDNPNAIYLASGVTSQMISDSMEQHKARQAERGMTRFIVPLVVGSLDPQANVDVKEIALKSLPDGFDEEVAMRWYINQLAMGFGADYQDFAPLPGRGLGSSTQSLVLHMKSAGKGPASFMKMMEFIFNFHGIIPRNVTYRYDEQDVEADTQQATLEKTVTESLEVQVTQGILTPQAARQVLLDKGFISQEIFELAGEGDEEAEDVTTDVTVQEEEPADGTQPTGRTGGVQTAARHPKRRRRKKPEKPDEDYKQAFSDFMEEERTALESTMVDQMEKVLAKAGREARKVMGLPSRGFASLNPFISTKQEPDDILSSDLFWADFQADAVGAMLPLVRQGAAEAAAINLDLGIGINLQLVNEEVLAFSQRYATDWWQTIEASSRRSLTNAIETWQRSGLGTRGLPDLADAITPTFGKARAENIAATEVTQIFDEGNRLAHNAGGITTEEWQTARDTRVDDEICRPLDGQRFPTNEGPRPVKDTHPRCRCARLPVGDDGGTLGGRGS